MTASKPNIASKSGTAKRTVESGEIDWAKVDAYENTPEDYEELPELTDEMLARATRHVNGVPVRGRPPLGERSKQQITLRLDPDVIEHFRAQGAGWQAAINAALRDAAKLD